MVNMHLLFPGVADPQNCSAKGVANRATSEGAEVGLWTVPSIDRVKLRAGGAVLGEVADV